VLNQGGASCANDSNRLCSPSKAGFTIPRGRGRFSAAEASHSLPGCSQPGLHVGGSWAGDGMIHYKRRVATSTVLIPRSPPTTSKSASASDSFSGPDRRPKTRATAPLANPVIGRVTRRAQRVTGLARPRAPGRAAASAAGTPPSTHTLHYSYTTLAWTKASRSPRSRTPCGGRHHS
jgi:hypothetical protein